MNDGCAKFSVKALGLSLGLIWAVAIFLTGMIASYSNWGHSFVAVMSSLYVGFKPTFMGSIIGAVWAFVDWFIGGCLFAWLYNCFSGHCSKSASGSISSGNMSGGNMSGSGSNMSGSGGSNTSSNM